MVPVAAGALAAPYLAGSGEVEVVDGDGLRLGDKRIRLWGIDAPEMDQSCEADGKSYPCGERSRDALAGIIAARNGLRSRTLATCGRSKS